MDSPTLQFDVVIAGGGFAGVYCARALAKELGGSTSRHRVALIADENFMVFQPMLAEVVGSSISPRHVVNPIRLLCPDITVLRGNIKSIDLPGRCMEVNAGNFTGNVAVHFEHLALAMGGIVDLSRVPGMPEHAFLLKNVGDALKLRAAIIGRFEEANLSCDPAAIERLLTFVIVGGGYSGVEVAGQIRDLGDEILGLYPRLRPENFRVVLVHSGAHLLPEISESLGRYCEDNLRGRGVEILLNTRVTAMTAGKISFDGRSVETHTVVSTIGNAPHPLLSEICKLNSLPTDKGRLLTDPTLQVKDQRQLWAAGDCAAVPMPRKQPRNPDKTQDHSPFTVRPYCPATAQFAVRQGTLLGQNIARVLTGEGALQPFTFSGLGELAAIGHHAAVAQIMGLKFSGFLAWWLWRTVYLAKLPGLERKLRVMIDWTLDLFFPRDITLFQSQPTRMLQQMSLQPGDALFHAGEPAFSFYILKSGRVELRAADGSLVRSVEAGDHFGQSALLENRIRSSNAVAIEASELVALSAEVFESVAQADKSIRDFLQESTKRPAQPASLS